MRSHMLLPISSHIADGSARPITRTEYDLAVTNGEREPALRSPAAALTGNRDPHSLARGAFDGAPQSAPKRTNLARPGEPVVGNVRLADLREWAKDSNALVYVLGNGRSRVTIFPEDVIDKTDEQLTAYIRERYNGLSAIR